MTIGRGPFRPLSQARVLVVEDEYHIADDVRRMLKSAGAEVVGPVSTLASAADTIESESFDCVLLDLNLHGESALPLAERLAELGVSFALTTGYGSSAVPEGLQDRPRIEKPFDAGALVDAVLDLMREPVA